MFQKGKSGNPGGRPRGALEMARMIREQTHDGADLVKHALKVWRDKKATPKDRQWAHEWLCDRGFGKAVQSVDVGFDGEHSLDEQPINMEDLSSEQLAALAMLDRDDPADG